MEGERRGRTIQVSSFRQPDMVREGLSEQPKVDRKVV
jgi:hypothetical protein